MQIENTVLYTADSLELGMIGEYGKLIRATEVNVDGKLELTWKFGFTEYTEVVWASTTYLIQK